MAMGIAKTTAYWVIGVFILVAKTAWATQHVVGGSQGWDQSTDYDTWAKSQTFKLGDTLVFKYSAGLHSVVELGSESEYSKCDISNAANSFNGGNNIVKLDKVGTKYYACGTAGHCSSGMKLKVNVVAADSTSPTSSSSSSGSPSSSSSSGSPSSSSSSSSGSSSSSSTPSSTSTSGAFAHVGNKGICSASLVAFVSLLFCYF